MRKAFRKTSRKAQILVLYAMLLPVMFLFMGLGIDVGLIYTSQAKLSRAMDATALRVARKFSSDATTRKQMALKLMRLNYPGFLPDPVTWTGSGDILTATTSVNSDTLQLSSMANEETGVIEVGITASTKHYTYFMPIGGAAFNNIPLNGGATAQRFPACNILILDISGSMRGGRDTALVNGVKAFLSEFVNDRDYVMVVTFSTFAKVVWPNIPHANGKFYPSKGFLDVSTGLASPYATKNVNSTISDRVKFAGATNAAEGVRYAFEQADQFLDEKGSEARKLMKVNYVFFTDGEFNTFRGFARGIGYGVSTTTPLKPLSTATFETTNSNSTYATLPSFHAVKPLMASNFASGGVISGSFTTGTSGISGTYDLGSRVESKDVSAMPGVNCVVQGYKGKSGGDLTSNVNNMTGTWTPGSGTVNGSFEHDTTYSGNWRPLYKDITISGSTNRYVSLTFNGGDISSATFWPSPAPVLNTGTDYLKGLNRDASFMGGTSVWSANGWANLLYKRLLGYGVPYNSVTNPLSAIPSPSPVEIAREAMKNRFDHAIYFPAAQIQSFNDGNAGAAAARAIEYYPGGRFFSNIDGQAIGTGTDASGNGTAASFYIEKNGSGLGPVNGVTGNYNSWNYGTIRMSAFYPNYSYGGGNEDPVDNTTAANTIVTNPSHYNTSGTAISGDNLMMLGPYTNDAAPAAGVATSVPAAVTTGDADWSRIGPPLEYYSFRTGGWLSTRTDSEDQITDEGNFLAEAQAWIVRKQHNATFFTILVGSTSPETVKRMANDNNGVAYYSDQPMGKSYQTTDTTQLTPIFREIAQKISVRLSE